MNPLLSAAMADFCCRFLDFPSLSSNHNLHLFLPSNHNHSSALLVHSHNSRINRIKRKLHLNHLSKPSLLTPFSSDFDVISTHEHSDGSVLFRFGDPSEVEKTVVIEEPENVKKEVITDGEDGDRVVKVLDGDHEKEVMVKKTDREIIIISELNEVADQVNSIDVRSKSNVTVVEKEIDSSEKLQESSNDIELPVLVSSTETEVIYNGNLDEGLIEDYDDPNIILDKSSEMEQSENVGEGMNEAHKGSSFDVENNVTKLETIDVTKLDSLISDPVIVVTDDDDFQVNPETVVTGDVSAVDEHQNVENEMQNEIFGDCREGSENEVISFVNFSGEIEDEDLLDGVQNLVIETGSENDVNQSMTVSQLEAGSMLGEENGAESINVLDNTSQDLILRSESTEVAENVQSGELVKAAVHESTELESNESATTSEENLVTNFVLSSGAALLPHPSKALTGGDDAYFVAGQTWLGVADGVGQWSLEGTNPGVYAQELIKNCEKLVSDCTENPINNPVELLNCSIVETHSPGSSTILVARFDGQALHVANIGDSGFIVLRNGAVYKRSTPMRHVFHFPLQIERGDDPSSLAEVYRVDLEEDDVIITATDGLLDNLYDQEISSMVMKSLAADKRLEDIADSLATKAQEIGRSESTRSPFADDAQAAGFAEYTGGKLDDVAVIVSVVRKQSNTEAF